MTHLEGTIALVAGATRGAGRGIAVSLGEAGATVYCTGRSTRGAEHPEQPRREHEPDGQQRADGRPVLVGELAEHAHRAERGGGDEAERGAGAAHRGHPVDGKLHDRFLFLPITR